MLRSTKPRDKREVDGEAALYRSVRRELGGEDRPFQWRGEQAPRPTPERTLKLKVQLDRVAEHLSAPHKIVPRIEDLARSVKGKDGKLQKPRITPNMKMAVQYYAVLAFVADGPSTGTGRYGDGGAASPAWGKSLTTDDRLQARVMFDMARLAAFGVKNRSGHWVCDEAARTALEPVLLGDDQAWNMGQIGSFLSTYNNDTSVSAAGTQEVVQVARRLRLFFRLGDD